MSLSPTLPSHARTLPMLLRCHNSYVRIWLCSCLRCVFPLSCTLYSLSHTRLWLYSHNHYCELFKQLISYRKQMSMTSWRERSWRLVLQLSKTCSSVLWHSTLTEAWDKVSCETWRRTPWQLRALIRARWRGNLHTSCNFFLAAEMYNDILHTIKYFLCSR